MGSSSAGNFARIVQEDALLASRASCQPRAFDVGDGCRLAVMAWSENLHAFGQTVEDAFSILSDWVDAMYACAGYEIKPDSPEVTVSSTNCFREKNVISGGRAWKLRNHLIWVGYCISSVGDRVHCRDIFVSAASRLFLGELTGVAQTFCASEPSLEVVEDFLQRPRRL